MELHTKVVPTSYMYNILKSAREQSISDQQLLENACLTVEEISAPGAYITHAQQIQIWINFARLSPEPSIGLTLGQKYRAHNSGIYGLTILTAETIRDALACASKLQLLTGSFTNFTHYVTKHEYCIQAINNYPLPGTHQLTIDEALSAHQAVLNPLTEPPLMPTRVNFDYPKPENIEPYREIFKCPVQFSAKTSEICYPISAGTMRLISHDADAHEVCKLRCEILLKKLQDAENMTGKVKKILLQLNNNRRNAEEVAERLHISPRHLRRMLSKEDTSFQIVLDDTRFDLSKNFLKQTILSIEEISSLIGYSETNNFRRAFKKWANLSPSEYRCQVKKE